MTTVKHIGQYVGKALLVAVLAAAALLLISAVKTKDAKPCSAIDIQYKKARQSGFVTRQEIMQAISSQVATEPVGTPLQKFDLKAIERSIEQHPWILDAQLYFDNNQVLHVIIDEPLPVARVIDVRGRHFYIDADAQEMPISKLHRVELPVVTGVPVRRDSATGRDIMRKVAALSEVIATDPFWMVQAAQIDVQANGRLELVPVIGNHIADLGYGDQPEAMLQRLKHFYKAMVASGRLDAYHRISAAYDGQIVAQRSHAAITKEDKAAAMQSYKQMVQSNQQAVDSASITSQKGVGRLVNTASADAPQPKQQATPVAPKPQDKAAAQEKPADKQPAGAANADKENKDNANKEKAKTDDKQETPKQEKVPKAVMPKLENN